MSLPYDRLYLVGCRFLRNMEETFFQMARQTGIEALGIIPDDSEVASRNLYGQDLISIDSENPAFKAADEMLRKLLQPNAMG